jgi:hypothetical protein
MKVNTLILNLYHCLTFIYYFIAYFWWIILPSYIRILLRLSQNSSNVKGLRDQIKLGNTDLTVKLVSQCERRTKIEDIWE